MASLVVLLLLQLSVTTLALAKCLNNSECRSHLVCKNESCVDPCQNSCGTEANCETNNHVPTCTCHPGYTGDPLTNCRRFNPEELCHPSPCGVNTLCEVVKNVPTCTCPPGYTGDPFTNCKRVNPEELCHPYPCGVNTLCEVINNVATCKCKPGYIGNPFPGCKYECENNADCGPQMACIGFRCQSEATVI